MIEAWFAFAFGLLIGSFLNVCIYRLPRDLSVVRPRSFCPECEKQIAWYDNIPVLSFLLLGGRCRYCKARFSWRYPVVELLTGVVFFLGVYKLGLSWAAARFCLYAAYLVALLFTDLETRILPDEFTKSGIVLGLLFAPLAHLPVLFGYLILPAGAPLWQTSLVESGLGAFVPSAFLWLTGWLYERIRKREGLGFGDVKMIAMIGAFTGLSGALTVLLYGSVLGTVVGLLFIAITRKSMATYELPLGSFLAFVALVHAAVTTLSSSG
ncbi:MAG TPA: prepilin peptidase [Bryobacteraceae bacterium]|nr:prepilin peptidase [Bryobacteraceae bacterium]